MSSRGIIKRYLPTTLYGRALMILVIPVIGVQILTAYMFYERHWDSVVRNMSNALAGEVIVLLDAFQNTDKNTRMPYTAAIGDMMGIGVTLDTSESKVFVSDKGKETYPDFFRDLSKRLGYPFMVERVGIEQDILISVLTDEGVLKLHTTKKRLVSPTTYIFIVWITGSAIILLLIAILFLRNQIRPIKQLAQAAEAFGTGNETVKFEPRGAEEVRMAGRAFVTMRDRIARQVATRTEMLAGISHDLRTPLTRIKLQFALLGLDKKTHDSLKSDVEEMEHMIREYLDFARGEGGEQGEVIQTKAYLESIVKGYLFHEDPVSLSCEGGTDIMVRPKALKRALQNIIDNALRYGDVAEIEARHDEEHFYVSIKDEGPGIPENRREQVFRPFTRLEASRNTETGGAGLGLSIARDVIQAHGGTIKLENADKGLLVNITLPLHQTK